MTATTIRVQMAQRKDTAANWTAANPILLSGEIGYETDTKKFKIGDGTTNWNNLAYLPIPDGSGNLTITGNLEIGTTGSLTFEGSTANGFETTLAVTDPTADRTITLPNVSGTVVTTGDSGSVTSTMIADGTIVNADISSSAEIAVSKLANGTANQVIVTDGTNVSWSDNLTLAGDLTVNGTTTTINTENLLVEDKNIIIGNVATPTDLTADGGGITLKGATDKTINWVDATDAWTSSERFSYPLGSATTPALTFTGDTNTGIYSPGADQVAISTNGTGRLFINSAGQIQSAGLGTAAAPAWNYVGDPNTGVFSPAADTWAVSTGGSERIRVDSSGRLGLGTTSPVGLLDVRGEIKAGSFDSINGTTLLSDSYTTGGASFGSLCIERGTGVFALTTNIKHAENAAGYISTNTVDFGKSALKLGSTGLFYATASASVVPIGNSVSLTDRFVITNAGNVGIGTTGPGHALQVNGAICATGTFGTASASTVVFDVAGDARILTTGPSGGGYNPLVFAQVNSSGGGYTERARIDSAGRLLVGTSSASGTNTLFESSSTAANSANVALVKRNSGTADQAGQQLHFYNFAPSGTARAAGTEVGNIRFYGSQPTSGAAQEMASIQCAADLIQTGANTSGRLVFSTTADGASSPTERMRISSGGVVMINDTTDLGAGIFQINDAPGRWAMTTSCTNADGGGIYYHWNIKSGTANVGSVTSTTTTTTFATSSDYRLKENVILLTGAIDRINQLPVHRFNFIADPDKTVDGFLAHEVQAVVPECVIGAKDAVDVDGNPVYQGIDQSKLVPLLTAALQEALAEIESLKARVTALEL